MCRRCHVIDVWENNWANLCPRCPFEFAENDDNDNSFYNGEGIGSDSNRGRYHDNGRKHHNFENGKNHKKIMMWV